MPLWTPERIATAQWLDADDAATLTLDGSGNVETWLDKSGNARHADIPAPVSGISVQNAALNGLDVVHFGGTTEALDFPSVGISGADHRLLICVARPRINQQGTSIMMLGGASVSGGGIAENGQAWRVRQDSSTANLRIEIQGSGYTSNLEFLGAGVYAVSLAGGTLADHVLWKNGIGEPATGAASVETVDSNNSIGGSTSIGDPGFDGDIAEYVLIKGTIDDGIRQKLEGYLAHKWGLAASLSAEHPYKNAAPIIASLFGTITDKDGNPAERRITVLDATGHCVATDTSDPVTGAYSIGMPNDDPYTLVFDGEPDRNAQVFANVISGEPPA